LTKHLELAHFQFDRPSHIVADASSTSVGGVLLQEQGPVDQLKGLHINKDGSESPPFNVRVVRWCSKSLSKSQQKWPISTRELYAQQIALKNFSLWTSGSTTYNWTDHKGLTQRLSPDEETNRDAIKVQACMAYGTTFKYLPGCASNKNAMVLPDAISRLCIALGKDPPSDEPVLPPAPSEPAHTLPMTTSYLGSLTEEGGSLISFDPIPIKTAQIVQLPKQSDKTSSTAGDIKSTPAPIVSQSTLHKILVFLFGTGKPKTPKAYQHLPFLVLMTMFIATVSGTKEHCPPTISGTYQIISSQVQLYQDFATIESNYRQQGYLICHWDATLITDTANCTIEGRHINVLPDWGPVNKTSYVTTAVKTKEIIVFTIQNETTIPLEGIKVVSRVIRVPIPPDKPEDKGFGGWDEDDELSPQDILLQNIIFPSSVGTSVLKWSHQCLRDHLYSSILDKMDDLTQFISTRWCTKQWRNFGKPDSGWQYYKMGYIMFACFWPNGRFSLSLDHIQTTQRQIEQQRLFNQWVTITTCMSKASHNGFPHYIQLLTQPSTIYLSPISNPKKSS